MHESFLNALVFSNRSILYSCDLLAAFLVEKEDDVSFRCYLLIKLPKSISSKSSSSSTSWLYSWSYDLFSALLTCMTSFLVFCKMGSFSFFFKKTLRVDLKLSMLVEKL